MQNNVKEEKKQFKYHSQNTHFVKTKNLPVSIINEKIQYLYVENVVASTKVLLPELLNKLTKVMTSSVYIKIISINARKLK